MKREFFFLIFHPACKKKRDCLFIFFFNDYSDYFDEVFVEFVDLETTYLDTYVCIDTKCEATLKNRIYIKNKCLDIEMQIVSFLLRVKDIDVTIHEIKKYVWISIFFFEQKNEKSILTRIIRKIHLMNDFKPNLFIDIDFLKSKDFTIDISNKKAFMMNCDIFIKILIKQRNFFIKRSIYTI